MGHILNLRYIYIASLKKKPLGPILVVLFKFVDDLTALEIVNLLMVGITCFNLKEQVPNDIPTHNSYISSEKLESQKYLNQINDGTIKQKTLINQN